MPSNFNRFPSSETPSTSEVPTSEVPSGENINTGEIPRDSAKVRGEKTLESIAAERAALTKELEALYSEREAILAKIKAIESAEATPTPAIIMPPVPEVPAGPSPDGAPVIAESPEVPESDTPTPELATPEPDTPEPEPEAPATPEAPETITPETVQKKAKNNRALKGVIAGVLAFAVAAGGFLLWKNNSKNATAAQPEIPAEDQGTIARPEAERQAIGIRDGYDKTGMWMQANKVENGQWQAGKNTVKFADAEALAEVHDFDEIEMMKDVAENEVEAYADYIANLPSALQPEGFKGLSILEAEQKLEMISKVSPAAYGALRQQFNGILDRALTRETTLNGEYDNAFIAPIDPSKPITHDNMKLVHCVTKEDATPATELYWLDEDGNEIGTMIVKIGRIKDEDGNIIKLKGCTQIVNKRGQGGGVYIDLDEFDDGDGGGITTEEKEDDGDGGGTSTEEEEDEGSGGGITTEEEEEDSRGGGGIERSEPDDGDEPGDDTPSDEPNYPGPSGGGDTPSTPPREWGKSGDPHGNSELNDLSEAPAADAEVTRQESESVNLGNQAYVDDSQATPGSSSESNGVTSNGSGAAENIGDGFAASGITAEGADNTGTRLTGGADQSVNDQGVAEMAGENAYQDQAAIVEGQARDAAGDAAQAAAQAAIRATEEASAGTSGGVDVGTIESSSTASSESTSSETGGSESSSESTVEAPAPASQETVNRVAEGNF